MGAKSKCRCKGNNKCSTECGNKKNKSCSNDNDCNTNNNFKQSKKNNSNDNSFMFDAVGSSMNGVKGYNFYLNENYK